MRLIVLSCGFMLSAVLAHAQEAQPQSAPAESPATQPASPPKPVPKPAAQSAPERKLMPVDEGGADPSWVAFRNRLISALKRGDRNALLAVVDRNIVNSLEAERGVATFRKLWGLDGKDDRLLRELASSLALGSAWYMRPKGPRLLCAPYVPIKWPLHEVDPYHNGAVVLQNAPVKAAPSWASETLASLNYDIVEVRDWEVADREPQLQQRWVRVRYRGDDGYVAEEHIRSAIEHRACFAKEGGTWRMVEYVVGIEFLGGD